MDHVQDFKEGVIQDFYDQPEGSLYDLQNFHLINTDGNTFAIASPEGNIHLKDLTPNYEPIGISGNQSRIIVHLAWIGNNTRHNGEIGLLKIDKQTFTATYEPLYNHIDLNYRIEHAIESLLYPENSRIEGNYWTDNFNPPRTINTLNPIFNTPILITDPLEDTKSYMVVEGSVFYNGLAYGPQSTNGTVFTAAAPNLSYSVNVAPYKVIEYFPIDLLDWTPKFKAGQIRLHKPLSGNAYCGVYTFLYQMMDEDGAVTNWSMPTLPIHVAGPGVVATTSASYAAHQGHPFQIRSTQGIRLEITNLDLNFNRLRVAMVFGTELNVYEKPIVIYDSSVDITQTHQGKPDDGNMIYVDFLGDEFLTELTEEDITQILLRIEKVKTIATVNNIMFPGNISYFKDVKWDPSKGVTAKCIQKSLTHDVLSYSPQETFVGHYAVSNPVLPTATGASRILFNQTYKVSGTNTVQYPPTTGPIYNPGDYFVGLRPSTNGGVLAELCTINPGAIVQQVIRIKKYNRAGTTPMYHDVVMDEDYADYLGMTACYWAKGYFRNEKYRLGLGLHDLAGNITYVRFLTDKEIPPLYADPSWQDPNHPGIPLGFSPNVIEMDDNFTGQRARANILPIGIEIDGINFNDLAIELGIAVSDLDKYFSGFSILRCPEDPHIVAQGWINKICNDNANNAKVPMCGWRLDDSQDYTDDGIYTGAEMFHSPEFQLHFNGLPSFAETPFFEILTDYFASEDPSNPYFSAGDINIPGAYTGTWRKKCTQMAPYDSNRHRKRLTLDRANSSAEITQGGNVVTNGVTFNNWMEPSGNNPMTQGNTNFSIIGSRGAFLVYNTNEIGSISRPGIYDTSRSVVNLLKNKTLFYGGNGTTAKANNQYIPTGHFQSFGPDLMAELNANNGILNGIEVWGGDAFIGFHSQAKDIKYTNHWGYIAQIGIPLESRVNFLLREGRTINSWKVPNEIDPEQWIYNKAYSNNYLTVPYDALPDRYLPVNEYPYRGLYSYRKTPGERVNSFRRFGSGNFRDVDGSNGPIINFKTKAMKLFYWQEDAIGYIPVNERAALSTALGEAVTIGEGGVMDRYDERSRFYGNQHQFGIAETPQGFVWPDIKRKTLCYSTGGQEVIELNAIKGMTSFLQSRINGNILSGDAPYTRLGVISGYDYKNKKTYITILGTDQGDFTMAFDHLKPQFAGFYPFLPTMYHPWGEDLLTNAEKLRLNFLAPQIYNIGDTVRGLLDNDTWTCVQAYTHSGSQDPNLFPAFWVRTSRRESIWIQNLGEIGKYYGRVHPSTLKFIALTKDAKIEKVFDNFIFQGSKAFFDRLTASTSDQSVTDLDLINNPEYEYRNKVWLSSVPIDDNTGRLVDLKLTVEMEKDNRFNGSPIDSKNEKTVLNSVVITYRKSY